jgi:ABC-2 type transport system permease protein
VTIPAGSRPFLTLYRREIRRFFKVAVQTVFAPIVSSTLYLLIFGVSLGAKITMEGGVSYLAFLIPGLIMMSVLNNSYQNSSSSIVSGKFGGDLEDWRVVPLSPQAILWALALGGLTRGVIVGLITCLVGEVFYFVMHQEWLVPHSPGLLLVFLIVGGLSFSMFGISVAFWAKTFDHVSGVGSFVLLPLIYLGGVFFSLEGLHPFWQTLSKVNPLLYFINGVRYSVLGQSDVSLTLAFVVSLSALAIFYGVALRILKTAQYTRW